MSERDWAAELGFDRLPTDSIDKPVTALMDLRGKKAIVTGAGGEGLGQAIAHRLAGLGADVALVGRTLSKVEQKAEDVRAKWGVKAVPVQADLSDWAQAHRAVAESREALGGFDIMINNPVMVDAALFERMTQQQIDLTVLGSLTMLLYCARAAVNPLLEQGSGTIINIASGAGREAQKGLSVYGACKAGVIGFTRNLANEVTPRGVNVLGVAPGIMIKPDLQERIVNAQSDGDHVARSSVMEALQTVRLGRVALPEEVANMVAYLCTPAASYMCGQTIDVSGGIYMN